MWEEFKKIDSRIIRPINGGEFFAKNSFLSVTDIFPKFSTEFFKEKAQENLSKLEVFNHALKIINGFPFWIKKPFKLYLEEVEWNEDEEMESYLKKEGKFLKPYQPVFDDEEKEVQLLFKFRICQLKNDKTKLTFYALHPISDGRTIFTMFDYIRKIIEGETLERNDEKLPSFEELEFFDNLDSSFDGKPPKVWSEISNLSLLPKINDHPIQYKAIHYLYDYAPIEKFCKENKVSVQAMLIAMMTRATRKYKNLPKETELWNGTPCDTRISPFASESHKNQKFYCNIAMVYPGVIGQDSLMEDIKHCMTRLQEAKARNEDVCQILSSKKVIDPVTLKFVPNGRFPNNHFNAVVSASNIGLINGNKPIFSLILRAPPNNMYNFIYYSYHTKDNLIISAQMPTNFDKTYVDLIKEEMDNIFIPENIC